MKYINNRVSGSATMFFRTFLVLAIVTTLGVINGGFGLIIDKPAAAQAPECSYEARNLTSNDVGRVLVFLTAINVDDYAFSAPLTDLFDDIVDMQDRLSGELDSGSTWLFMNCPGAGGQYILMEDSEGSIRFFNPDLAINDPDVVVIAESPGFTSISTSGAGAPVQLYTATNPDVAINWLRDGSVGGGEEPPPPEPVVGQCTYVARVPNQAEIDKISVLLYTIGGALRGGENFDQLANTVSLLKSQQNLDRTWLYLNYNGVSYILDGADAGVVDHVDDMQFINPDNVNARAIARAPNYRNVRISAAVRCIAGNYEFASDWIDDNAYLLDPSIPEPSCSREFPAAIAWAVCAGIGWADEAINKLVDTLNSLLSVGPGEVNTPEMRKAWSYFRNIASLFLVIIGLVMIIGQAVGKN